VEFTTYSADTAMNFRGMRFTGLATVRMKEKLVKKPKQQAHLTRLLSSISVGWDQCQFIFLVTADKRFSE